MFESKVRFSSPLCNCWIDYFVSFDKKVIVYGNLIYSHHNDILIITIGILEIIEFEKYFNKFRDKKKLLELLERWIITMILLWLVNLQLEKVLQKLLKIDTLKIHAKKNMESFVNYRHRQNFNKNFIRKQFNREKDLKKKMYRIICLF